MHSRKQYLEELRKEYEQAGQLQRGRLLDEAQKRTGMNRKYLIPGSGVKSRISGLDGSEPADLCQDVVGEVL